MTPTYGLRESCGHRTGVSRLQALPKPELQRIEADEARISGQQQVLMSAVFGSLPSEFQRLHKNQACWRSRAELVVCDRFRGESDSVLILLRGKTTHLRKTVVVPDNLGTAAETKAILDCIVHKRFFGDW